MRRRGRRTTPRDEVMKPGSVPKCCASSPTSASTTIARWATPGPEGSISKIGRRQPQQGHLRGARQPDGRRRCSTAATRWCGPSTPWSTPPRRRRSCAVAGTRSRAARRKRCSTSSASVLGLPGDVRVDREVPWSQVPATDHPSARLGWSPHTRERVRSGGAGVEQDAQEDGSDRSERLHGAADGDGQACSSLRRESQRRHPPAWPRRS